MARVDKLGGNWVIVRDDGMEEPDAVSHSPAPRYTDSSANREFWTGTGWAGQYGVARQFAEKEEAETYLAEHRNEMA